MTAEKHTDDYARQDVNETLAGLEVDAARGLSESEARQRLTRYGYNEIEDKEEALLAPPVPPLLGTDPLDDRARGAALCRGAEVG